MSNLYSVYDSVADVYVFFGEFDHDRTAIDFFLQRCFYLPRSGEDMFLCVIGSYNSLTGEVDALERPKRIARGFSIDEGKKEPLSSPSAENDNSTNQDKSQAKKHINLRRRRGFYAVLFALLLAVCAICCVVVTGCNFINVESIENGKVF